MRTTNASRTMNVKLTTQRGKTLAQPRLKIKNEQDVVSGNYIRRAPSLLPILTHTRESEPSKKLLDDQRGKNHSSHANLRPSCRGLTAIEFLQPQSSSYFAKQHLTSPKPTTLSTTTPTNKFSYQQIPLSTAPIINQLL